MPCNAYVYLVELAHKTKSTFSTHLAELQTLAIETFDSKSEAESWLNKFHPILGNTRLLLLNHLQGLLKSRKYLAQLVTAEVFS